jgi:hypothetical protein
MVRLSGNCTLLYFHGSCLSNKMGVSLIKYRSFLIDKGVFVIERQVLVTSKKRDER